MLVYGGQMAGWISIPLGTEVGLGPGDIVLNGTQLPPRKGAQQPPTFWPMSCGQTAGWIRIPLGTEPGLGPSNIVLDGIQLSPHKEAQQPPTVWPMYIVAKRLVGLGYHLVQR